MSDNKDKNNDGGTILDFSKSKPANDADVKARDTFKVPEPLRPRYEVTRENLDGSLVTEVFEGHVAMDRTWFAVMRTEDGLLIHAFPAMSIVSCTLLDA